MKKIRYRPIVMGSALGARRRSLGELFGCPVLRTTAKSTWLRQPLIEAILSIISESVSRVPIAASTVAKFRSFVFDETAFACVHLPKVLVAAVHPGARALPREGSEAR